MKKTSPVLLVVLLVACKGHTFHPPDREKQVAQADSAYSPALFDSIRWPSDAGRLLAGNEVYARKCDKCHGPDGRDHTAYARDKHLNVPSLVEPNWRYSADHEGVRRRIFTGHAKGMTTWGVGELSPREIDAVAGYVIEQLRPDALLQVK